MIRIPRAAAAVPTIAISLARNDSLTAISPHCEDLRALKVDARRHIPHCAPILEHELHDIPFTVEFWRRHGSPGEYHLLPVAFHRGDRPLENAVAEGVARRRARLLIDRTDQLVVRPTSDLLEERLGEKLPVDRARRIIGVDDHAEGHPAIGVDDTRTPAECGEEDDQDRDSPYRAHSPSPSLEVAGRLDDEDTPVHRICEHGLLAASVDQLRPVHEMPLDLNDPEAVDVEA